MSALGSACIHRPCGNQLIDEPAMSAATTSPSPRGGGIGWSRRLPGGDEYAAAGFGPAPSRSGWLVAGWLLAGRGDRPGTTTARCRSRRGLLVCCRPPAWRGRCTCRERNRSWSPSHSVGAGAGQCMELHGRYQRPGGQARFCCARAGYAAVLGDAALAGLILAGVLPASVVQRAAGEGLPRRDVGSGAFGYVVAALFAG